MLQIPDAFRQIVIDMETVTDLLTRLSGDLASIPDPDAVKVTSGPSAHVAAGLSAALRGAAGRAAQATVNTREELLTMDKDIRETLAALTANDEDAAAAAKRVDMSMNKVEVQAAVDAVQAKVAEAKEAAAEEVATGTDTMDHGGRA